MTPNASTRNTQDDAPLIATAAAAAPACTENTNMVIPSSIGGTVPELTVHGLLLEHADDNVSVAMTFWRKAFALLVFQYSTVLVVASPFALIESFKDAIQPFHHTLLLLSIAIMVTSIVLALTKGDVYPYSRVVICTLTLSVAVELGLTFSQVAWGDYGLIAVGQATASFALLLALFQFIEKDESLYESMTLGLASLLCLVLSGIWTVILTEAGLNVGIAVAVSLGGWLFCMLNLVQFKTLCKMVAPGEYVFATLFILFPQALLMLNSSKKRKPPDNNTSNATKVETNATKTKYGTTSGTNLA